MAPASEPTPRDAAALAATLRRIDGRGYKAYKDVRGRYAVDGLVLCIDHVQGDPFAAPSKLRLRLADDDAGWPPELSRTRVRRVALADFLAREVQRELPGRGGPRRGPPGRLAGGSGKSGQVRIDAGGQEVLERSAVRLGDGFVEARIEVGLPAAGRRVLGGEAETLLLEALPRLAERSLVAGAAARDRARTFVECVENQEALRSTLAERGWIAFVADGSVLPRASGATERPLAPERAIPFEAPAALAAEVELPNPLPGDGGRVLRGLPVQEGVTLIVGGGYHGKSTLLRAIERGVHAHVPGDGREYVVARRDLVKIRAEDGRRVEGVDISPFIDGLPGAANGGAERPSTRSTRCFRSDDASGSTSQAANIVEAVEVGARGLLLDEDTCATNFMVRDARMQALVASDHEPITPFLDRVRELADAGISSLLVMGGCGDYFDVADRVLRMQDYRVHDATAEARRVADAHPTTRRRETRRPWEPPPPRVPLAESIQAARGRRDVRIDVRGPDRLELGTETIDLRAVEQLAGESMLRAIGHAIWLARNEWMDGARSLADVLDALEGALDEHGLDRLATFGRPGEHPGSFARPRRFEVAAALNRLRSLRVGP